MSIGDIVNLVVEAPKKEGHTKRKGIYLMIERYDWTLLKKFAKYLDSKDATQNSIPRDFMQKQLDTGEITQETAQRLISEINAYAWDRRLKLDTSNHPPKITIITRPEGFVWESDILS